MKHQVRGFLDMLGLQSFCRTTGVGYLQTSLTNFQREGHFRYEDCSYRTELYDWAGFGPEALSRLFSLYLRRTSATISAMEGTLLVLGLAFRAYYAGNARQGSTKRAF